jgi:hypothetical protein
MDANLYTACIILSFISLNAHCRSEFEIKVANILQKLGIPHCDVSRNIKRNFYEIGVNYVF